MTIAVTQDATAGATLSIDASVEDSDATMIDGTTFGTPLYIGSKDATGDYVFLGEIAEIGVV